MRTTEWDVLVTVGQQIARVDLGEVDLDLEEARDVARPVAAALADAHGIERPR